MTAFVPPAEDGRVLPWEQLAILAWQATSALRRDVHVRMGGRGCPTRRAPYSGVGVRSADSHSECANVGCLDLYHDVLLAAHLRLNGVRDGRLPEPRDVHGYAYTAITRLLADRKREARVRRGWPARPGREDGPAARVIERLWALDPQGAPWLVTLLRLLQHYAHRADRDSCAWPLLGWATEKTSFDGQPRADNEATRAEIRADITYVLRVATSVLGAQWVYVNVHQPLLTALEPVQIDPESHSTTTDLDELMLARWLRTWYAAARRRGLSRDAALADMAGRLGVRELVVTNEVRAALADLDKDLRLSA